MTVKSKSSAARGVRSFSLSLELQAHLDEHIQALRVTDFGEKTEFWGDPSTASGRKKLVSRYGAEKTAQFVREMSAKNRLKSTATRETSVSRVVENLLRGALNMPELT